MGFFPPLAKLAITSIQWGNIGFYAFFGFLFFNPPWIIQGEYNRGWVGLAVLQILLLVGIAIKKPFFSVRVNPKWIVLFIILLVVGIFNGTHFLAERWIQRFFLASLWILFISFIHSEKTLFDFFGYPLLVFTGAILIHSLVQFLGCDPLTDSLGRSCFSSIFYNINLLGQFLTLSFVVLAYYFNYFERRVQVLIMTMLSLAVTVILLSYNRSAWVSLVFVVIVCLFFSNILSKRKLLTILSLSGVLFFLLSSMKTTFFQNPISFLNPTSFILNASGKVGFSQSRLSMWRETVKMAVDNPLGVSTSFFEFGFLPYKSAIDSVDLILELDRSPHNEFLRILVEEGFLFFIMMTSVILSLLIYAYKTVYVKKHINLITIITLALVPELIFQFPLDNFFPCLIIGLAVAPVVNGKTFSLPMSVKTKFFLIILYVFTSAIVIIRYTTFLPGLVSPHYCRLFPDNWRQCGNYFKQHYSDNQYHKARQTIVPVIKNQPFNFVALHFYAMISSEKEKEKIRCLIKNLLKNQYQALGEPRHTCTRFLTKTEMIKEFKSFAEQL